jgi:CRISPR-associated endoribonuclease Cas6
MLLSTLIPLTATNTPEESPYLGRACYALFLSLVGRANPSLAEELHEPRRSKPFTVSALFSWDRPNLVQPKVREGERYWIRFTSIEAHLSRLLAEEVLPNLPASVQLGPATFAPQAPIVESEGHPWARTTTAEALVDRWFSSAGRVGKRFTLEFASPTAYRRIHRNVVVPLPAGIFRGYLDAWNRHCAPAFDRDLLDLVEAEVAITRYELRTAMLRIGQAREIGCLGRCGYTIFRRERAVWRVINLLADFAQFCGTGYKTTQGMGQTRLVVSPKS